MSTFASQIQVCECCESEQIESKSFYTIIFGSEFNRAFYKTKVDINFHGGNLRAPAMHEFTLWAREISLQGESDYATCR